MTEYGSPPPGGWPSGQAPQQSHEYSAPPGYRPTTAFDPKTVDPLDWAILAGAVIALIFSFFSFYEYTATGPDAEQACKTVTNVPLVHDLCNGVDNSAWHGFFGWFGVLLLLLAAVVVAVALFAPQVNLPAPARMVALVLAALGFVFVLIALFVVPDGDYQGNTIPADSPNFDAGHGFSYWVVLVLAAVVTALCALRLVQTNGETDAAVGAPGGTGATGPTGAAGPVGAAGAAGAAGMTHAGGTSGYQPPPQQDYGPQQGNPAQPPSAAPPPAAPQSPGYQQPGYQQPGYQQQPPPAPPSQPGYVAPPPPPAQAPPQDAPPAPPPPAPQPTPAPPQPSAPAAPPAEAAQEPPADNPPEEPPPGYIPPPQE